MDLVSSHWKGLFAYHAGMTHAKMFIMTGQDVLIRILVSYFYDINLHWLYLKSGHNKWALRKAESALALPGHFVVQGLYNVSDAK